MSCNTAIIDLNVNAIGEKMLLSEKHRGSESVFED